MINDINISQIVKDDEHFEREITLIEESFSERNSNYVIENKNVNISSSHDNTSYAYTEERKFFLLI